MVISYRSTEMPNKFPAEVSQRPRVVGVSGRRATFRDGSAADFDSVVLATGYLHHYPHMGGGMRLQSANLLFIKDLYKVGVV